MRAKLILSVAVVAMFFPVANAAVLMQYDFDGVQGQAVPGTVGDATGTISFTKHLEPGGALTYGPSNPLVNTSGTSASFDGLSGLYRNDGGVGDPLDLTISGYTIEMFIKPDTINQSALIRKFQGGYIFDIRGSGMEGNLWFAQSGQEDDADEVSSADLGPIMAGNWYHVACVFDSTSPAPMKVYLDGELAGTGLIADLNADNADPVGIGAIRRTDGTIGQFFDGLIDELTVTDVALDPTEFITRRPGVAIRPRPRNNQTMVPLGTVINWKPGEFAVSHNVYFGTDKTAVENATNPAVLPGRGNQDPNSYNPGALELGETYYWRIDEVNGAHPDSPWRGDVWRFKTAGFAFDPVPEDGSEDTRIDAVLQWTAGTGALSHNVYFGTDKTAVENAMNPAVLPGRGNQAATTFNPGSLAFSTTYYWRIDEVTASKINKGDVWSFEIGDRSVFDNFETYDESIRPFPKPLLATWNEAGGAFLYLAMATAPHYGGDQAMRIDYFNVNPYVYSEGLTTLSPVRDWSSQAKAIELFYRGNPASGENNASGEAFYVYLEDSTGKGSSVSRMLSAAEIADAEWKSWSLALQDFASGGVDLSRVAKMGIGIGDRKGSSGSGAYGLFYVDDISLHPSRCLAEFAPEADLTGDCLVNFEDHAVLAGDWQKVEQVLDFGVQPNSASLRLWYKFDEGTGSSALDSSVNARDGLLVTSGLPVWEPGHDGLCLVFDDDTAVTGPTDVFNGLTSGVTITAWLNIGIGTENRANAVAHAGQNTTFLLAQVPDTQGNVSWRAGDSTNTVAWTGTKLDDWRGSWNHYAFVRDLTAQTMAIYYNGLKVAEKTGTTGSLADLAGAVFDIGALIEHNNDFIGKLDEFRIYGYALSQAEVIGAATPTNVLTVPLRSMANLVQSDATQIIDYKDLDVVADQWLDEIIWP